MNKKLSDENTQFLLDWFKYYDVEGYWGDPKEIEAKVLEETLKNKGKIEAKQAKSSNRQAKSSKVKLNKIK